MWFCADYSNSFTSFPSAVGNSILIVLDTKSCLQNDWELGARHRPSAQYWDVSCDCRAVTMCMQSDYDSLCYFPSVHPLVSVLIPKLFLTMETSSHKFVLPCVNSHPFARFPLTLYAITLPVKLALCSIWTCLKNATNDYLLLLALLLSFATRGLVLGMAVSDCGSHLPPVWRMTMQFCKDIHGVQTIFWLFL